MFELNVMPHFYKNKLLVKNLQILKQEENRVETPFCITHNIFQSLDNAESMISSSKVSMGKGVKLRKR